MKETGIVRRMDDLGRIVIPKAVRRDMGVREGDPLEIYQTGDCTILRKYKEDGVAPKVASKDSLLQYLEDQTRLYKELGKDFEERRLELEAMRNKLVSGEFDW